MMEIHANSPWSELIQPDEFEETHLLNQQGLSPLSSVQRGGKGASPAVGGRGELVLNEQS